MIQDDASKIRELEERICTLKELQSYYDRDRVLIAKTVLSKMTNGDWYNLNDEDPDLVDFVFKAICKARDENV